MIKLIILEDNKPVFNPEVRMFKPLKRLLERDKGSKGDVDGRKKLVSTKELAFIYWYIDPRSNYVDVYPDEKIRAERIKKHLDLPEDWKIDVDIKAAIDFYLEQINRDFDMMYLESNISAASKTRDWLMSVDYSLRDSRGKMLYDPLHIAKIAKEAGGVIEGLKILKTKALKAESLSTKIRGGGEKALFEDANDEDDE